MLASFRYQFRRERSALLRQLQITVGSIALVANVVAIIFFFDWLGQTDWLMGHVYGPASSILTATWSAGVGVLCAVIWLAIAFFNKSSFTEGRQQKRTGWRLLRGGVLGLLALSGVVIFAFGMLELPHALRKLDVQQIKAGDASVAELIEGMKSSDHETRFWAVTELRKLGRGAMPAVPVLAEALSDAAIAPQAAETLGNIGPEAEAAIPALVAAIERERGKASGIGSGGPSTFSWRCGLALAQIGPASIPELIKLLAHEDRHVRMTAANALKEIGPRAKDAVPALNQASNDEDESVRRSVRAALARIGSRPNVGMAEPAAPETTTLEDTAPEDTAPAAPAKVHEQPSAAWTTQAPFSGRARDRPPGTLGLQFDDGYRWPVKAHSVRRWDHRVEGQRSIQAAITATHRYEHVLGTHEVRIIDSRASLAVEGAP